MSWRVSNGLQRQSRLLANARRCGIKLRNSIKKMVREAYTNYIIADYIMYVLNEGNYLASFVLSFSD